MVDVPAVHRTKPGASGNCVASSGLCLVQLPSPRTRRADVLADIARSLPGAGIVAGCATNCIRRALFLVVDRKRVDASTVSVARQTETTVGRPNGRIRTSGDAGAGLSVRDPGSGIGAGISAGISAGIGAGQPGGGSGTGPGPRPRAGPHLRIGV